MKEKGLSCVHKIHENSTILLFTVAKYVIKIKVYQSINTCRLYMAPFIVEKSVNKHEDATINHKCLKLAAVNTVFL